MLGSATGSLTGRAWAGLGVAGRLLGEDVAQLRGGRTCTEHATNRQAESTLTHQTAVGGLLNDGTCALLGAAAAADAALAPNAPVGELAVNGARVLAAAGRLGQHVAEAAAIGRRRLRTAACRTSGPVAARGATLRPHHDGARASHGATAAAGGALGPGTPVAEDAVDGALHA